MATQSEILKLLRKYKPNRLTPGDIRLKLKSGSITNQLKQLRQFRFVKFKLVKMKHTKTHKEGYVYWV